ncbi:ATP-dependent nuclease subunit B [Streptococcus catagoni]|uniref:ATP-dependent nuclease subunit B n=1 Tax=Streptococcus catagoni TaxID=2654874 RepID=UPI001407F7EE|nr:ATP-dependent nuclease subunit B [Streptococcus catagoni]
MRLLYTEIHYSIREILTKEAHDYAKKGYRVFYIAPSSLSFEKERAVLEELPEEASFDITITRFAQMARYFTLNSQKNTENLDDNALTMLIYKALLQIDEKDLLLYSALKADLTFIQELLDLYKELKTSQLSVFDLVLENEAKKQDLITIFTKLDELLSQTNYTFSSKLIDFAEEIESGHLDQNLAKTVIIIDGFTRFSAEEEYLIHQLNKRCKDIIIGTYISKKAYKTNFFAGNVYEASLDFVAKLAADYQRKPEYVEGVKEYCQSFQKLSHFFEAKHDFTQLEPLLEEEDKKHISIWQNSDQKEEIENVAKDIRQKLYTGHRYKDILVLLGDVEAYQLQIGHIFDKFDIPYYFGKAETMSHHPLVQFIDSLERCKRYNWRREDLINLLKSGLFSKITENELDHFESYLDFADIHGYTKFSKDFTINSKAKQDKLKFDLKSLNQQRKLVFFPLQKLFKSQKQLGSSLIKQVMAFFSEISLAANFQKMSQGQNETILEREEQVWKTFTDILEHFYHIFSDQKMTLDEALSLIKVAMLSADYRVIPGNLDVVSVKSYDLIEPHHKAFVYAIGLTQSNFPKVVINHSLISDQERAKTNELRQAFKHFDIASEESGKKGLYTALSLFNAAQDQLILSSPLVLNEVSEEQSVYLKELLSFGVPFIEKDREPLTNLDADIGNYKSLLSKMIEINRSELDLNPDEKNFWTVMLRYLKKRLEANTLFWEQNPNHIQTKTVSEEVMNLRFPEDKPLNLSTSALTIYYENQYKYFLQYVLELQELESIHPDARHHGTYLHRVFEMVLADQSQISFDEKVDKALQVVNQEKIFKQFYQEDAEAKYSLRVLEDIVKATASVLKINQTIETLRQEERFKLPLGDKLIISGTIDRIDRLSDQSLGVVDYKSSPNKFDIEKFYNGLNSQLITYLNALQEVMKEDKSSKLFGAMYLHMQEPKMDLSHFKNVDEKLIEKVYDDLKYKGIFLETEKDKLANGLYQIKNNIFTAEELELLLAYNQNLFLKTEGAIRRGHFLINPYTEDGKTVKGDQLKAITRFESDLDLGQARHLLKLPAKEKRQGFLELMRNEQKGGL